MKEKHEIQKNEEHEQLIHHHVHTKTSAGVQASIPGYKLKLFFTREVLSDTDCDNKGDDTPPATPRRPSLGN